MTKKKLLLCLCLLSVQTGAATLEQYEHRVACNPDDYRALYNVGVEAFRADDMEKAKAAFDCLKPMCSKEQWGVSHSEKIHYNAGNTEVKMENFADAVESFEAVLQYNPENEIAQKKLAFAKEMLKQREQQNQKSENEGGHDKDGEKEPEKNKENEQGDSDQKPDGQSDDQEYSGEDERNDDLESHDETQQSNQKQDRDNDESHNQPNSNEERDDDTKQEQSNPKSSSEQGQQACQNSSGQPDLTEQEERLLAGLEAFDRDMNKKHAERSLRAVVGGYHEKNW